MQTTRNDIKALAKGRHPSALTIELRRHSDFKSLGTAATDTDELDWLLTITGGGKPPVEYKAATLDEMHAILSAEQ